MAHLDIWEREGLCRVFTGKISCSEILDSNIELHASPRFDDIKYLINDFTGSTEFEASSRDIKECIAIDNAASKSKQQLRVAMVAKIEPILTCAHLYALKMENSSFECRIFDNIDDARCWLSELKLIAEPSILLKPAEPKNIRLLS